MVVTIPDEILRSAHLSEAEFRREIAVALYQRDRLTLGAAAALAEVPLLDFQRLLASLGIPLQYSPDQLASDLSMAERRPRLR